MLPGRRRRAAARASSVTRGVRRLVDDLVAAYDVRVESPRSAPPGVRLAVRLVPARGAPVSLVVLPEGSVEVARGHWDRATMPGTLVVDDVVRPPPTPSELVADVERQVLEVVEGSFTEWLEAGRRGTEGRAYKAATRVPPERLAELVAVAPPGHYDWPAWPRR